jgi:hypothetical protein
MTAQDYLQSLLNSQNLQEGELSALRKLRETIEAQLRSGLGKLERVYYAGSFAKGTMIREHYDLDIVLYWGNDCGFTLEGIYNGVGKVLNEHWKVVKPKTVSWELPFEGGFHIDVVPGRALDGTFKYANLYRRDTKSSLQTSIKVHIDTVRDSGRRDAIRLIKLWRKRRGLPLIKSLALELLTINACSGKPSSDLAKQVWATFEYLRDNITTVRLVDPANSNNIISDQISSQDKQAIKQAAINALAAKTWEAIFNP